MGKSLHQSGDVIIDAQTQLSYRIVNILGEGNSGITYTAEDIRNNGEKVAIKALSFQQVQDWKMMELFEREAKVLSILKHPGIPRYINYFHTDTQRDTPQESLRDRKFYIVQELAPGKSLAAWVESGLRWNEASIYQFAEQILHILIYLQKITPPVIHRDIKPQNIIRDQKNALRLVDFGAVRDTYYSTLMRGSTVVGTYGYMAPEQFRGQAVPATDLYGLGATILYLLTHRSPAEIPQNGLSLDFRDRIQVSEGFANWLETMLAPDANERFPSAQVALDALHQQQKVKIKQPYKPSKIDAFVAILLVTGAALWFGNVNKWRLFSAFGIIPRAICEDTSVVQNYLQQGGNPNATNNSRFLLYCASAEGAELLLKYGANPNLDESIIFYAAVTQKDIEKVKLLLKYRAKPNQRLLHRVILNGQLDMVQLLVNHGADINRKVSGYSDLIPLDLALARNEFEMAKVLLKKGAIANKFADSERLFKLKKQIEQENQQNK